jgi:uncharacterized protein YdiU (UPF0061 family)
MPLSESIEKPLTAEPTSGPIAVLSNSYARLPEHFFARLSPTPVAKPRLIKFNESLASELGVDTRGVEPDELAAVFAGNLIPPGAEPIAMAYAGHQFGNFVPQLGDGRAILLGEVVDPNGKRRDIQLKGAGRTPFSRRGDGRAALGPVLREYLISEAMHSLGIPTTRALAAASTGETVFRDRQLPGAVLTRVASSHIRIGTFQYFAVRGDMEAVERLSGYAIDRHFPDARDFERPPLTMLQIVVERQALLVARWMLVGFIHGVMNTDNTALSGETIDFGPCAFMDSYDPATVFSAIDELGRYAYGNQPTIARWNLARFAEILLPLLDPNLERAVELANETISGFTTRFQEHWLAGMRNKLGLSSTEEGDPDLANALLRAMHENAADFTLTFRRLSDAAANEKADTDVRALFANPLAYDNWAARWRSRLAAETLKPEARAQAMRNVNPAFIPRNHRVEQVLSAAIEYGDFSPFTEMLIVLSRPYEDQADFGVYANPPHANERIFRTFCGT